MGGNAKNTFHLGSDNSFGLRPFIKPAARAHSYDTLPCFCCGGAVAVDLGASIVRSTVTGNTETVTPCAAAPRICAVCRQDPVKLQAARAAMHDHFRQCDQHGRSAA